MEIARQFLARRQFGACYQTGSLLHFLWVALFLVLLPFICVLAYNADYGHNENPYAYLISYMAGMACAIAMTLFFRKTIKSLAWLGTISYSVYLVHPFFLEWAAHATDLSAAFNVGVFLLYVLATLTLSSISYVLLEKPCVSLARTINRRLQTGLAQGLQPVSPRASDNNS
ncbi:acyltransferase family protein [Pseudomonas sp. LB1P83]